MKLSKNKIVNFIVENCNTQTPGTADQYTIWAQGRELKITRGSMRYREEDIKELFSFSFHNEHAPYSRAYVKDLVEKKTLSLNINFRLIKK